MGGQRGSWVSLEVWHARRKIRDLSNTNSESPLFSMRAVLSLAQSAWRELVMLLKRDIQWSLGVNFGLLSKALRLDGYLDHVLSPSNLFLLSIFLT